MEMNPSMKRCYICDSFVSMSGYIKSGGTEAQWNSAMVGVICCMCLKHVTIHGIDYVLDGKGFWWNEIGDHSAPMNGASKTIGR
jgi:hypothetical protein